MNILAFFAIYEYSEYLCLVSFFRILNLLLVISTSWSKGPENDSSILSSLKCAKWNFHEFSFMLTNICSISCHAFGNHNVYVQIIPDTFLYIGGTSPCVGHFPQFLILQFFLRFAIRFFLACQTLTM